MKVAFAMSADLSASLSGLWKGACTALASLPPPPALSNFVSADIKGDLLVGGPVSITLAPAPALVSWVNAVRAKLTAFEMAAGGNDKAA